MNLFYRDTSTKSGRVFRALRLYHRRAELARLIVWARRKRLTPVADYYEQLHLRCEQGIMSIRLRDQSALRVAGLMYIINRIVTPPPRYYRKGSASRYRLRRKSPTWTMPFGVIQ